MFYNDDLFLQVDNQNLEIRLKKLQVEVLFIKELNKMFGKHLFYFFVGISFRAAAKNKSSSGEDALEAFSKIDKKNENLFTQEDRKNKFKNSL